MKMDDFKIEKELKDISWQVPESVYRADPALSYSTLSRYERDGFDKISHLFDQIETPSTVFGSCVDSILTGGLDEFNSRFVVMDIKISDGGKDVCKAVVQYTKDNMLPYASFNDIPEDVVSMIAKNVGFWKADKWDKRRYNEVLGTGDIAKYYSMLTQTDRTVIDTATYDKVVACVRALRESPATHGYFADNDPMSPVRRYYQLKFKANLDGVDYRCMMDLACVDYEDKVIYPVDLKTSSHTEWNFQESFCTWSY